MKQECFALAAVAALALSGCATMPASIPSLPPAPAAIAERTVLDEQSLIGLELLYKAARLAGEFGVDAGAIRGDTALRIGKLDNARSPR